MSKFRGLLVAALAVGGLGALAPGALASGSAQGPPAGPTTPPFYQCPAIGLDTTCQFLINVTSANPSGAAVASTIIEDPSQSYYDGSDDVTVAVQNDSAVPLSSIHLGVAGSGPEDDPFGFDGDGLCEPGSGPSPDGCPFGPPGNNGDPYDYFGPDTVLTADPVAEGEPLDAGTVSFPTPLQPGQYTYFSLEAEPGGHPSIASGETNDVLTTALTDPESTELEGLTAELKLPAPANVTDQATLLGLNSTEATGTVTYRVYSDSLCTTEVGHSAKTVTAGVFPASDPIGAALPNNARYYWVVEYSGNAAPHENDPAKTPCGSETMAFGTPPTLPVPAVTTVLTGGGQAGAKITVPPGTAVTDNTTITSPGGQPVSGRLSYEIYTDPSCFPFTQLKGAGGGLTTGSGPASNPLTLPSGTYYYQASYSGNGVLAPAVSPCGSEVLTVAAATPPPPPPPPSGQFFPVGNPQFNVRTGQIVVLAQFPAPGTATSTGIVQQGATLARAQEAALVEQALAEAARHKKSSKCKRGYVKKGKKCLNNAPVVYGTTVQTIPAPGTYSIIINPSGKVLNALKAGKKLNVVITTTFQNRAGGAPVAHLQSVFVKLKPKPKPKKHHKKH